MKIFLKPIVTILLCTLFIVSCGQQTAIHYSSKKTATIKTMLKPLSAIGVSRFVSNTPVESAGNYGKRTPVADLSKGMYLVRMKSDNKVVTGKFTK